jgi:putative endonuclease
MFRLTHWPWFRRWFGDRSEQVAANFLRQSGLRILHRNYRTPRGEIDLIARDGSRVVFVEVRSTAGNDSVRLAASIDRGKQRRIVGAAEFFLHRYRMGDCPARFDVVLVQWTKDGSPIVTHIPTAFDLTNL